MALLQDKIVLVNGGSQGVGAGIVRAAVREGATVVFTGVVTWMLIPLVIAALGCAATAVVAIPARRGR